jgi:glycosyltransferase involved in cell wall biosynthesis
MRVIHVTPYFAPAFRYGGPPRSILGLCQALTKAGVDVEVFTTTANGDEPLPPAPEGTEYDGVRVRYFPLSWPKRYWRASGLRAALDRALPQADLVHVHGLWNMTGSTAVARARAAGRPYAISPRGMLQPAAMKRNAALKTAAYWASERAHLRGAAFLHATSLVEREQLEAYGPPVVTIANGVSPATVSQDAVDGLRRRIGIDAGDEVVLCLGRLHPIKRLDLLAAAFATVRRSRPRARLIIAGPDEGGYRARVEPLFAPVAGATHWLGAVDAGTVGELFAASRMLVQCSDSESFGLSVAEALACGLPVVVTDRTPWSQVSELQLGYAVAHEAEAIARGILAILERPGDGCAMGARGKAWARETFGWDAIGRSMRDAYHSVIEPARRPEARA